MLLLAPAHSETTPQWMEACRPDTKVTGLVRCCALRAVWWEEGLLAQALSDSYLVTEQVVAPTTRIPGSQLELGGGTAAKLEVGIHLEQSTLRCVALVGFEPLDIMLEKREGVLQFSSLG